MQYTRSVDCDFLVSETVQEFLFQLTKMLLLTKLLLLLATAVITYRSNFTCNNYSLTEKKHNFLQAHFQYLNSACRHKKILLRPADTIILLILQI